MKKREGAEARPRRRQPELLKAAVRYLEDRGAALFRLFALPLEEMTLASFKTTVA